MREKDFMRQVTELAQWHGWRVYHTHDSRRSAPGFPDLTMVRGGRMVFAELKVGRNKLTDHQEEWIASLKTVGRPVEAYAWWPRHWEEIEKILA